MGAVCIVLPRHLGNGLCVRSISCWREIEDEMKRTQVRAGFAKHLALTTDWNVAC
jgi:hypothetical protein